MSSPQPLPSATPTLQPSTATASALSDSIHDSQTSPSPLTSYQNSDSPPVPTTAASEFGHNSRTPPAPTSYQNSDSPLLSSASGQAPSSAGALTKPASYGSHSDTMQRGGRSMSSEKHDPLKSDTELDDNDGEGHSMRDISLSKQPKNITQNDAVYINVASDERDDPEVQCRICLEHDPVAELINPCRCKGGSKFVHRSCLDQWRATDAGGLRFKQCDVCHFFFQLDEVNESDDQQHWRLWRYRFYVSRDILISFIGLNFIVIIFSLMIASVDSEQHAIIQLFPVAMQAHPYLVFWLCGFTIFLACVGLLGSCVACTTRNHPNDFLPSCYGWWWFTDCSCLEATAASDGVGLLIGLGVLVVLAVVGSIIGIYFGMYATRQILKKHSTKLWLKEETKRYVVKDMYGLELPPQNDIQPPATSSTAQQQQHIDLDEDDDDLMDRHAIHV